MIRAVNPRRATDIERHATQRGVEICHEVTEQVRRKVADKDVGEWVVPGPQAPVENAFVLNVATRSPTLSGSHAIKRLVRSAERQ